MPPTDSNLNRLSQEYEYDDLLAATEGFSETARLGLGTYGAVYRGALRDGTEVAIKALHRPNESGFREEVEVLSRFRHPNLVILMGFARRAQERYLVYELLAGGDVCARLRQDDASFMWRARLDVALDAALGLSHLHGSRPQVFHRDIKTQNILMDRNGSGKMADFGLALLAQPNEDSLTVAQTSGTIGYADPLYIRTGKVTEKSEVYSFGMVLLELLTRSPPALQHENGRIEYQFAHIGGDPEKVAAMVDHRAHWPHAVSSQVGALALRCTHELEARRPTFVELVGRLRQLLREEHAEGPADLPPQWPSLSQSPAAPSGALSASRGSATLPLRPSEAAREAAERVLLRSEALHAGTAAAVEPSLGVAANLGAGGSSVVGRAAATDSRMLLAEARSAGDALPWVSLASPLASSFAGPVVAEPANWLAASGRRPSAEATGAAAATAASLAPPPEIIDCGPTARLDCGLPPCGLENELKEADGGMGACSGFGMGSYFGTSEFAPGGYGPLAPVELADKASLMSGQISQAALFGARQFSTSVGDGLDHGGHILPPESRWPAPLPERLLQSPEALRPFTEALRPAPEGSSSFTATPAGRPMAMSAACGATGTAVGSVGGCAGGCAGGSAGSTASVSVGNACVAASPEREAEVRQVQDLGFSLHQATEAFKRCSTVESAVDWILSPEREWNL